MANNKGKLLNYIKNIGLPVPSFSIVKSKEEFKKAAKAAQDYVRKESLRLLGFESDILIIENSPVEGILGRPKHWRPT
jgi:hypothetical protein